MTRDELARIAMRYDTLMADAMLRALGVDRPPTRRRKGRAYQKGGRYDGARELMAQAHGVRL